MASLDALRGLCQPEVERHLGCALSPEQAAQLPRLLAERARKLRLEPHIYARRLAAGELPDEPLQLAGHFTIGESYFFRDLAQLTACCELIVKRVRETGGPIRILSAGCSTGEEPYSILMLAHEQLGGTNMLEVSAVDINRSALERAKKARYSSWALRETPDHLRERWFRREGRDYQLSSEITSRVSFDCASLSVPSQALAARTYDVILCRNVIMYFTPEGYHEAALRLINALVPSGFLLLGHAESLRGLGLPADLMQVGDSFCYRKAAPRAASTSNPLTHLLQSAPVAPNLAIGSPSPPEGRTTHGGEWASSAESPLAATSSALSVELSTLASVTPLLESERFADALRALEALPESDSPVQQLCFALLHVYTNRFDRAKALATPLLNVEAVAAEAHYALALCHEYSGDWAKATDLARRATYLDPTFAMPWLHLGILSRKRGDGLAARRELLEARALLTVEPQERLVWFGGGCSRATLLAACQRELASTRGAA